VVASQRDALPHEVEMGKHGYARQASNDKHAPIRITAAAEPDTLMLVMPMIWPEQAQAAE
jgi:hypothetical protein